jgi:hypothetical protein
MPNDILELKTDIGKDARRGRKFGVVRFSSKDRCHRYYLRHKEKILKHNSTYNKQYYLKNKDKIKEKTKVYRTEHLEKYKNYGKSYRNKNKDEHRIWHKNYNRHNYRNNPEFLILSRLRALLYINLKNYTEEGKIMSSKRYGIDWNRILKKLIPNGQLPFPIEERSNWHIDHIVPVSKFDLTEPLEIKKCFDADNLQWLTREENLRKSDKL